MTGRIVLHVDMDAFFASVEARDNPELRGRPVIVGADPSGGRGRGVVAAASYEARALGVHSAMPISHAWRLAPDAAYLRPRFQRYVEVSDEVFGAIGPMVDILEAASIDESYADITVRAGARFDRAADLGGRIQQLVRDRFRLSCSIGVGGSKLVAKIATDLHKPSGLTVVPPDRVAEVLGPLPARRIPGVGPKTTQALAALGIGTIAQLAAADPQHLQDRFGRWGPEMIQLSQGTDDRPVVAEWDRKSAGAEETFLEDLQPAACAAALEDVAGEAAQRLRATGQQGRTITLKVRLASFTTYTRARSLPTPTDDPAAIRRVAQQLLGDSPLPEPVRLLGVRISGLTGAGAKQARLPDFPDDPVAVAPALHGGYRWRF